MKACIVGAGNMGTALACLLSENGRKVTCWDHVPQVVEDIRRNHRNEKYLPGVDLHPSIQSELLLGRAVQDAAIIISAVPSPFFRHVAAECSPFLRHDAVWVNAAKGLEPQHFKRLSQVFADVSQVLSNRYVVLSGPATANEFARKKPTTVVAASTSDSARNKIVQALSNSYFHVEETNDVAGAEWGGILKNVYAIGLGLVTGLGAGEANLKAAFLAAAFREMKRLAVALGAEAKTLDGPAGLGDLMASAFSKESHNHRLGDLLGQGRSFEDAIDSMGGSVPEGVRSSTRAVELAAEHKVEVPLAVVVASCFKGPVPPKSRLLSAIWKSC